MTTSDVIVVGGGIIGCSVALALAREGLAVRLLERDAIGAHASSAAAGMLAPIAESEGAGPLLELGTAALARFASRVDEVRALSGIDPQLALVGVLRLHTKEGGAPTAGDAPDIPALRALGVETWDAAEVRRHVPGIASEIARGLYCPREGHVDAARLTQATAAAAEQAGARLQPGTPVLDLLRQGNRITGVRTPEGAQTCGQVVWCTGAWARHAVPSPRPLPVEPVKGQMIAVRPQSARSGPILFGDRVYLVPRRDGSVGVGATVERVGFDARPTLAGAHALAGAAVELVPALGDARLEAAWAGLRPGTPDGLPLVGACPGLAGLVLAVGHDRNGILLSERTGQWVADHMLRPAASSRALELLDPGRFA